MIYSNIWNHKFKKNMMSRPMVGDLERMQANKANENTKNSKKNNRVKKI